MTAADPPDSIFTCECCGGSFKRTGGEDQATNELIENGFEGLELAVVCEDCYIMLMAARRRAAH